MKRRGWAEKEFSRGRKCRMRMRRCLWIVVFVVLLVYTEHLVDTQAHTTMKQEDEESEGEEEDSEDDGE